MPKSHRTEQKNPVKSNTVKDPNILRYSVYIYEEEHKLLQAKLTSLFLAEYLALHYLDNSMPGNTVHVIDEVTGKEIGHAFLVGDLSPVWAQAL